jgi:hypothetical protein
MTMLACCNPCGARTYCAAHRSAVRGPRTSSAARFEAEILRWLDDRR